MENKIEKLIKDDFHKREMNPNSNAFERLEVKLRNHKAAKKRKLLLYVGYVASIIGLIFILQISFRTNEVKTKNTVVTSTNTIDSADIKTTERNYSPIVVNKTEPKPTNELKPSKKQQIEVLLTDNKQLRLNTEPIAETIFVVDSAAKEVVVSFNDTLNDSFIIKEVTEAEIDALLALANQSISKNSQDSLTISARRMLYEIEVEINKPLPEKVLLTIKTGTNTIKEIVKSNTNEKN